MAFHQRPDGGNVVQDVSAPDPSRALLSLLRSTNSSQHSPSAPETASGWPPERLPPASNLFTGFSGYSDVVPPLNIHHVQQVPPSLKALWTEPAQGVPKANQHASTGALEGRMWGLHGGSGATGVRGPHSSQMGLNSDRPASFGSEFGDGNALGVPPAHAREGGVSVRSQEGFSGARTGSSQPANQDPWGRPGATNEDEETGWRDWKTKAAQLAVGSASAVAAEGGFTNGGPTGSPWASLSSPSPWDSASPAFTRSLFNQPPPGASSFGHLRNGFHGLEEALPFPPGVPPAHFGATSVAWSTSDYSLNAPSLGSRPIGAPPAHNDPSSRVWSTSDNFMKQPTLGHAAAGVPSAHSGSQMWSAPDSFTAPPSLGSAEWAQDPYLWGFKGPPKTLHAPVGVAAPVAAPESVLLQGHGDQDGGTGWHGDRDTGTGWHGVRERGTDWHGNRIGGAGWHEGREGADEWHRAENLEKGTLSASALEEELLSRFGGMNVAPGQHRGAQQSSAMGSAPAGPGSDVPFAHGAHAAVGAHGAGGAHAAGGALALGASGMLQVGEVQRRAEGRQEPLHQGQQGQQGQEEEEEQQVGYSNGQGVGAAEMGARDGGSSGNNGEGTQSFPAQQPLAGRSIHPRTRLVPPDTLSGGAPRAHHPPPPPPVALPPPHIPQLRVDMLKFNAGLEALVASLVPTPDEEQRRDALLRRLEEIMKAVYPGARLYLYGSCANSFGVRNSDIDVCLVLDGPNVSRVEVITRAANMVRAEGMDNIQALTHARVPIVKFEDPVTNVACDMCVNNLVAVSNTRLLRDYARVDPRLRQLAFLVKHWARQRRVNETYKGTLSSYAYVLMCIHFLQTRKPPILPCLQARRPHTYKTIVGDINCSYFDRVDTLQSFGSENKETAAQLLAAFFEYWAFRHDYNRAVISVRTATLLSKEEKEWTRRVGNERHLICIEDPFDVSHDLGRVVDRNSIRILRDEFHRAAKVLRNDWNPLTILFEPYVQENDQNRS